MVEDWFVYLGGGLGLISLVSVSLIAKNVEKQLQKMGVKQSNLEQKVKAVTTGAVGMGHRILALEERINTIKVDESNTNDGDHFAYTQAMQMFDQGADTETVASNCGFSSSEAQLMALVQKRMKQRSEASI